MISKELFDRCVAFIGLQLPNGAFDLFDRYAKLLTKYNEKVNLTAVTDPDGIVIKHFADSLCLLVQVELPRNAAGKKLHVQLREQAARDLAEGRLLRP